MILTAVIEIPAGSKVKFEINKKTGRVKVDRLLNQKVPFNYGFIDGNNIEMDGDQIDVFILGEESLPSLSEVEVELHGVVYCKDNGIQDNKLLAHVVGDDAFGEFGNSLIRNYLTTYKKGFVVERFGNKEEAERVYEESKALYVAHNLF